jgi:hypothetical protein
MPQSRAKLVERSREATDAPVHLVPTALARRFALICNTAIAEAIAGSNLTPLQYGLLRHLDVEGPIYQNGLAGRLGTDQSNASLRYNSTVKMSPPSLLPERA